RPRRASRSCPSIVASAYTLRVGTPSWPDSARPARSCTTTRNPSAIKTTAKSTCRQAVLLLPDIPLAEELLELLLQILVVAQPGLHRDDVLAVVRDDVRADLPFARVRRE